MKKEDLIKEISETQDGKALTKTNHLDEDFISRYILKSVDEATTKGGVDLEDVETDLSYAIRELTRAKAAVSRIIEKEEVERKAMEKDFEIPVVRTSHAFRTIKVKATSLEEAQRLALEEAGDYEFSEKNSDYSIEE